MTITDEMIAAARAVLCADIEPCAWPTDDEMRAALEAALAAAPQWIDVDDRRYEELRALIDGGSESMTHADAIEAVQIWREAYAAPAAPQAERDEDRRLMRMVQEMQEKDEAALREQVIRMAREAGFTLQRDERLFTEMLERFFHLAYAAGAAAEREACANLCEDEAERWEGDDGPISTEARLCAIRIRARGEK